MTILRCLLLALLVLFFPTLAGAEDFSALIDRSEVVESESASLLTEHYQFGEELLQPQDDRLTVFLTLKPFGAAIIMNELTLYLNDKPVVVHPYTESELVQFLDWSSQLVFAARIPPGLHTLRAEITVRQGKLAPMETYVFVKESKAKFIELQVAGSPVREILATDW